MQQGQVEISSQGVGWGSVDRKIFETLAARGEGVYQTVLADFCWSWGNQVSPGGWGTKNMIRY